MHHEILFDHRLATTVKSAIATTTASATATTATTAITTMTTSLTSTAMASVTITVTLLLNYSCHRHQHKHNHYDDHYFKCYHDHADVGDIATDTPRAAASTTTATLTAPYLICSHRNQPSMKSRHDIPMD